MLHSIKTKYFFYLFVYFSTVNSSLLSQDIELTINVHDSVSVLNINNWDLWVTSEGNISGNPANAGYYKNINAIYSSGLLFGGYVNDRADTTIRIGGSSYGVGLRPGKVLYNEIGSVAGPSSDQKAKIWRMRRDYRTADLRKDAAVLFNKLIDEITEEDLWSIYNKYEFDWQNWPVHQGAPFIDMNGDNEYDPHVDVPGRPNAKQLIWTVSNDLPDTSGKAPSYDLHGSPPIGIEQQLTVWATDEFSLYNSYGYKNLLKDAVFCEYRIIYTGLADTPIDATIDPMYFCQWSDPDVGYYGDDLIGVDTTLKIGYAYNGDENDEFYDKLEKPPAAVGHIILERISTDNLPMSLSAFCDYPSPNPYADPGPLNHYYWSLKVLNSMEGFDQEPVLGNYYGLPRKPFVDPTTGKITKFKYYGNPVLGTGWIDNNIGDRRFFFTSGPLSLAVGDTQKFVVALVGGDGGNYLENVEILRDRAELIKELYKNGQFDNETIQIDDPINTLYFGLYKNYPNPFNSSTVIHYDLPVDGNVEIAIYDILGKRITTLINEFQKAGKKEIIWNGTDEFGKEVGTGIYFYHFNSNGYIGGRKMVLIK